MKPEKTTRQWHAISLGGLILLILSSGISLVYYQQQARKLLSELQTLRKQEAVLNLEWKQLRLEESTLSSEAKLDRVARQQLNMFMPPPDQIVYLNPTVQ